jgi:hypothetical protein
MLRVFSKTDFIKFWIKCLVGRVTGNVVLP